MAFYGMEDKITTWDSIISFVKDFNLFLIALLIPLNKAINKYFEYQKTKDKEAIREVVNEVVRHNLDQIRSDLKDIKKQQEEDRKQLYKSILDLTKEIRK